jgi:hypothetical protein
MVTNSFGKRNFMQPLGRFSMNSLTVHFFFEGVRGEQFFGFISLVPNVFSIATGFYLI